MTELEHPPKEDEPEKIISISKDDDKPSLNNIKDDDDEDDDEDTFRITTTKEKAINSIYTYENILIDKYKLLRTEIISSSKKYRSRHFNGFMQLLYEPFGESYFLCQATNQYLIPDWKLHVSVKKDDYEKTWNCLIGIFFKYELLALKMQVQGKKWKKYGRGFTIYMYTDHKKYDEFEISYQWKRKGEVLKSKFENIKVDYNVWNQVINEIETNLEKLNVVSSDCEKGDFAIGKYVSIRNESFVLRKIKDPFNENEMIEKLLYPPDECGFNPRGHDFPLIPQCKWDFKHLLPEVSEASYFQYSRVLIPQFQYKVYEFDKIFLEIKNMKNKKEEFVNSIIVSYSLTALFCLSFTNRIKSIDFLVSIFRDKVSWKKQSREFVIESLKKVIKFCQNEDVLDYARKKLADLMNFYLMKKKLSNGKRLIKKCLVVSNEDQLNIST